MFAIFEGFDRWLKNQKLRTRANMFDSITASWDILSARLFIRGICDIKLDSQGSVCLFFVMRHDNR